MTFGDPLGVLFVQKPDAANTVSKKSINGTVSVGLMVDISIFNGIINQLINPMVISQFAMV